MSVATMARTNILKITKFYLRCLYLYLPIGVSVMIGKVEIYNIRKGMSIIIENKEII